MASELELAGLLSQVDDDAGDEEIFAAQWQHESDRSRSSAIRVVMAKAFNREPPARQLRRPWQLRAPLWGRGAAAPLVALRTT